MSSTGWILTVLVTVCVCRGTQGEDCVPTTPHKEKHGGKADRMCREYSSMSARYIYPHCTAVRGPDPSDVITFKMIGGRAAEDRHFPHLVSLSVDGSHICGASLISERHLLTTAHCFMPLISEGRTGVKKRLMWKYSGEGLKAYSAILGVNDLLDRRAQRLPLKAVYLHPKFRETNLRNDLAVVELEAKVEFSSVVRPACLDTQQWSTFRRGIIGGWGVTDTDVYSEAVNQLMFLEVDEIEASQCIERYRYFKKFLAYKHKHKIICTRGVSNYSHNACKGDSGGPLQTKSGCVYTVVGIVSHGSPEYYGEDRNNITAFCESGYVVLSKVSHFLSWIESVVWPDLD